ncbi:MAG: hypothetical protein AAGF12_24860 [Myxococcota bacterium]
MRERLSNRLLPMAAVGALLLTGALPPRHAGELHLPSPAPVSSLSVLEADHPFEASLAAATTDGLYRFDDRGRPRPLLAIGRPEREGLVARFELMETGRHRGARLAPRSVVASLRRAALHPRTSWLFANVRRQDGEPLIDNPEDRIITIESSRPAELRFVLATLPAAIQGGGDRRRAPIGTGPFQARLSASGEVDLRAFTAAPRGAPYLRRIRISPPAPRRTALQDYELGNIDGSWFGESLYGGQPVRPSTTTLLPARAPVLLLRSRRVSDGTFGRVAQAIDRRRLRRTGVEGSDTLRPGLPPPRDSSPAGAPRPLRMLVCTGDAFEARVAEALAGLLDEAGIALTVVELPPDRYRRAIDRGEHDLRLVQLVVPASSPGAVVGAALVAAGQPDRAEALVREGLLRSDRVGSYAEELDAVVLGRRRPALSHRADLGPLAFDAFGRILLDDLFLRRP